MSTVVSRTKLPCWRVSATHAQCPLDVRSAKCSEPPATGRQAAKGRRVEPNASSRRLHHGRQLNEPAVISRQAQRLTLRCTCTYLHLVSPCYVERTEARCQHLRDLGPCALPELLSRCVFNVGESRVHYLLLQPQYFLCICTRSTDTRRAIHHCACTTHYSQARRAERSSSLFLRALYSHALTVDAFEKMIGWTCAYCSWAGSADTPNACTTCGQRSTSYTLSYLETCPVGLGWPVERELLRQDRCLALVELCLALVELCLEVVELCLVLAERWLDLAERWHRQALLRLALLRFCHRWYHRQHLRPTTPPHHRDHASLSKAPRRPR